MLLEIVTITLQKLAHGCSSTASDFYLESICSMVALLGGTEEFNVNAQALMRLNPFAPQVISKELYRKPAAAAKLASEVSIHSSVQHPHIVRYLTKAEDEHNVYILLERCSARQASVCV